MTAAESRSRVVVLTAAPLARNPRVRKEARALAEAGLAVTVLGAGLDREQLDADQAMARRDGFTFESVEVTPRGVRRDRVRSTCARARMRLGREAFKIFGIENRWQVGAMLPALVRTARRANADYYIAHMEQGLWAGTRLLREGRRVGVDMEDWHSEDLMPEARRQRPIALLQSLEGEILRGNGHTTCPSTAMSRALTDAYACSPPTVIYNSFAWSERCHRDDARQDRIGDAVPSIHWYSQTIGPGRGLEDLLAALPHLTHDAEVHLRGHPVAGFAEWLAARVPPDWRTRVIVHDVVSNDDLLSRISEHDIGFAGEMKYSRSRDLTVTNKILHYLLAGLAVVASDTAGQREVAAQAPGAVALYASGDVRALSQQLDALLASPQRLAAARAAALDAAEKTFCWERQEQLLVTQVRQALGSS